MIKSQLEILAQGKSFLESINAEQYTEVRKPFFSSSAGVHLRHILDHYLALMAATEGVVNYNVRHRFCDVENDIAAAKKTILEIEQWIESLSEQILASALRVISEISICDQTDSETESTFARELIFVSSHAVHHYSMMKIIAQMQGVELEQNFGVAPATATFRREQKIAS